MEKHFTLFVLMLSLTAFAEAGVIHSKDSIGLERIEGNVFILHKVEPKETFYSLSRRYNVSIDDIIKYNPDAEAGLKIDNVLKIPYKVGNRQASSKLTHTVQPSQTLFAISRLYDVTVADIKKWNGLVSSDLNVGQTLTIYTNGLKHRDNAVVKEIKKEEEVVKSENSGKVKEDQKETSGKVVHKVEPSQTLYSISQMYNVSVDEIKNWNNMSGNTLEVGQQLTIRVKSKPSRYDDSVVISSKQEEAVQEQVARLDNKAASLDDSKPEPAAMEEKDEKEEKRAEKKRENVSGFKKVVELGMAEVIEAASDTKKYVALHRTAPIGTIMQVTNEMNNQNVFVRVIGKLPATGVNDKVLIKLSKPAFERLGAVNDRFPAEISYVP